jgi:oligopeptide transport system substrate-binding protein
MRSIRGSAIADVVRAVLLAVALLFAAAPIAAAQPATSQAARLTFLAQGEPESLDPNRGSAARAGEAAVVRQLFEPLLRFDEDLIPRPAAAASYDVSDDGTVYTFHLRPEGQWSDGQHVTAAQFEYAWKRLLDPVLQSEYAPFFVAAGIVGAADYHAGKTANAERVGVHAVDDGTLEVRLVQPFGALPNLAALWVGAPVRPDLVEAAPDDWAQHPSTVIGNGPFVVSEWVHQDHLTLTPNPRYTAHGAWPKPTLTRVLLPIGSSGNSDLAAFVSGEPDWTLVPDSEANRVLNDSDLAPLVLRYNELSTFWIQVNVDRGPLADSNVRRAMAKGLDRAAIVHDTASGVSEPTTTVIPRGMPGFQPDVGADLEFDPPGGRALLAAAGFQDGAGLEQLSFTYPATPAFTQRALYLRAQWKQHLGVDVQLTPLDQASYQQALEDKDYDLAFAGWSADYPDPQDWFGALFGCGAAFNTSNYCNAAFDQVVARADSSLSFTDRVQLYGRAQSILMQDAPVLPLFTREHLALVQPWVRSVDGGPLLVTPLDEYPGSLFLDKVQILPH